MFNHINVMKMREVYSEATYVTTLYTKMRGERFIREKVLREGMLIHVDKSYIDELKACLKKRI